MKYEMHVNAMQRCNNYDECIESVIQGYNQGMTTVILKTTSLRLFSRNLNILTPLDPYFLILYQLQFQKGSLITSQAGFCCIAYLIEGDE